MARNRYADILNQMNEKIPTMVQDIQERIDNPNDVDEVINKLVRQSELTEPFHKAHLAKDLATMGIGTRVEDELGDLSKLSTVERAEKIRDVAYKGMPEVRSSIKSNLNDPHLLSFDDLRNEIRVDPNFKRLGESHDYGITLKDDPDFPLTHRMGVDLHEFGHNYDDAVRLAKAKYDHLLKLDDKDPDIAKEKDRVKKALDYMIKNKPESMQILANKDLRYYRPKPFDEKSLRFPDEATQKKTPVQLGKQLIDKHHFNRNFEFDNLINIIKGGLKNVRGITPILAKAAATAAGGAIALGAEAADSENVGDHIAENAMIRDRDEQVRRYKNLKKSTPIEQEVLESMYDDIDSGDNQEKRNNRYKQLLNKMR
jgi:hypothetical protein